MATGFKKQSSANKSAQSRLRSVTKQAKGLGIDTRRAESMLSQTKRQGSRSFAGSREETALNKDLAITPEKLVTAKVPPVVPVPTVSNVPDFSAAGNQAIATSTQGVEYKDGMISNVPYEPTSSTDTTGQEKNFQSYISNIIGNKQPNTEKMFTNLEKEQGIKQKQEEFNKYSAQLNSITAESQAAQLGLEGQGRGITETIIGGQQAQINREAAIKALPVQAQLLAAQGNLEFAQQRVDTLFKLRSADATAKYDLSNKIYQAYYDHGNEIQKTKLDALKLREDRAYAEKQQSVSDAKNLAMQAIEYGQSSLAARIMGLDSNSPTYTQDVRSAMGQLRKPVSAKEPSLQNFGTAASPLWKQYNPATGGWEDIQGISNTPESNVLGQALSQGKIENVTSILNNSAIGSAVGPSSLARTAPGLWGAAKRFFSGFLTGAATTGLATLPTGLASVPAAIIGGLITGTVNASRGSMSELTGDRQSFIGSVEQLRSELTVDKLAQAKGQGVTFGALSDGERMLIANAATKLGTWAIHEDGDVNKPVIGYNIDEKNFKREIDTINYYQKLDAVLRGSSPESVGAIQQADGTYWVANSDGTLSQLIQR